MIQNKINGSLVESSDLVIINLHIVKFRYMTNHYIVQDYQINMIY